jgi:hypothetical protein
MVVVVIQFSIWRRAGPIGPIRVADLSLDRRLNDSQPTSTDDIDPSGAGADVPSGRLLGKWRRWVL